MSTAVAPMSVEQFLALPEEEGIRRELIEGEVIRIAHAGQPHEAVKSNFLQELGAFLKQNPIGRVMGETMYQLGPHSSPQPDVSVVLRAHWQSARGSLIPSCPDIAIEVVSSEPANVLRTKVQLYLRHGASAVWVAYPDLRMIQVYAAQGVRELTRDEPMETDILPGFRVPAAAFFVDL